MAELEECPRLPVDCSNSLTACAVENWLVDSQVWGRHVLLNSWVTVFGLICVLQFHVVLWVVIWRSWPRSKSRTYRAACGLVRILGRNIVVLNMYYREGTLWSIAGSHPYTCSLLFVFLDNIAYLIVHGLSRWRGKANLVRRVRTKSNDDPGLISTQYADWSLSTPYTAFLFFAQVSLFVMFNLSMASDADTHDRCSTVLWQWVVGVTVTNISGSQEAGDAFDMDVWMTMNDNMWVTRGEGSDKCIAGKIPNKMRLEPTPVSRLCFGIRMFMDFLINGFCRESLLGVAPVMLSVSDRMNFIKDCLAIFFISSMDDINAKSLLESLTQRWHNTVEEVEEEDPEADQESETVSSEEHVTLGTSDASQNLLHKTD